jgi:hypothetical protein
LRNPEPGSGIEFPHRHSRQGPTWENAMRLLLALAALALSVAPIQANEESPKLNVGAGIICNTSEQALRVVALGNQGSEIPIALQLVNRESANPTACGKAIVAFRIVEEVQHERIRGRTVSVMKIVVSAISNGAHWTPVPDLVQYALVVPEGIEV